MRLLVALVVACSAPKQPAATNDLEPTRDTTAVSVEPDASVVDASPVAAASIDARVASPEAAACEDDPASKEACLAMGESFAPRMVVPCHRGAAPSPMKNVARCTCVDTTKPARDCPAKK
jgi:hypothetical protein